MQSKWMSKKETAQYLSISIRTLENWVNESRFTRYKIGGRIYFNVHEIDKVIEKSKLPTPRFNEII